MSRNESPERVQIMKQVLRQRIIAGRDGLIVTERIRMSRAIVENIINLMVFRTASAVLAYMNFGTECSTEEWVQQMLDVGKHVFLPRVNNLTQELDVYRVTDLRHDLAPGLFGVREPIAERCEKLHVLKEIDFILLPGVAFGRDGARLGYGGGFYDKLLARIENEDQGRRPALVAGAFSMQLIEDVPQEITDQRVEWLVTEGETIRCV